MPEHDHPLDLLGQAGRQQQPPGRPARPAAPGVAGRLGQQRDPRRRRQLGHRPARDRRRVAGDDHRLRPGRQLHRRRSAPRAATRQLVAGSAAGRTPVGTSGSLSSTLSCTGPGCRLRARSPPAMQPGRSRTARSRGSGGRSDRAANAAHVPAEQPVLVGGLVGPGVDQRARPAGGDQRPAGRGCARPRAPRDAGWPRPCRRWSPPRPGAPDALARPRARKPARPLVDPDVQPEQADPVRLVDLVRQRRAARAGGEHELRTPWPISSATTTRAHRVASATASSGRSRDRPALGSASSRACQNRADLGGRCASSPVRRDPVRHPAT